MVGAEPIKAGSIWIMSNTTNKEKSGPNRRVWPACSVYPGNSGTVAWAGISRYLFGSALFSKCASYKNQKFHTGVRNINIRSNSPYSRLSNEPHHTTASLNTQQQAQPFLCCACFCVISASKSVPRSYGRSGRTVRPSASAL